MAGGFLGCNYQFPTASSSARKATPIGQTSVAARRHFLAAHSRFCERLLRDAVRLPSFGPRPAGIRLDRTLLYATTAQCRQTLPNTTCRQAAEGFSTTLQRPSRLTVGGGLEYAFLYNLIGLVEYRYSDFGTFSYAPPIFAPFVEIRRITENQVLVGSPTVWPRTDGTW